VPGKPDEQRWLRAIKDILQTKDTHPVYRGGTVDCTLRRNSAWLMEPNCLFDPQARGVALSKPGQVVEERFRALPSTTDHGFMPATPTVCVKLAGKIDTQTHIRELIELACWTL